MPGGQKLFRGHNTKHEKEQMMKKKVVSVLMSIGMAAVLLAGCGQSTAAEPSQARVSQEEETEEDAAGSGAAQTEGTDAAETAETETSDTEAAEEVVTEEAAAEDSGAADADISADSSELADGVYSAKFETDNNMFSVNEANDGLGVLTVADGKMTIHVSLASERIVNLFEGTAEDAQKDGAELLNPTVDQVTYSDGTTEEVYGFDIPVPALDEEFDVALVGTKGKWYDHKVTVSDPQSITEEEAAKLADVVEENASSESSATEDADVAEADTGSTGAADDAEAASDESSAADGTEAAGETGETTASAEDQAAADKVADLIDDIYVQTRNDQTDEQCAAAREAWDALTDAQRKLVSGENADPDYFGRDTGDASLDDPMNDDDIGENELLVVSFGTSFNNSRAKDIHGVERALQEAFPDWSVRRAFTAQIIINHVEARNSEYIDNMDQALQRAVDSGVKNLVVQPTHLMHGAEYDELVEAVENYKDQFDSVKVAEPLLGEVGASAGDVNEDKETVAKAVTAAAVEEAGYDSLENAAADGTAFVFMGHGTSHEANITYDQMQSQMEDLGYQNVFIGTVEGKPADTACEAVIDKVHDAGYTKVVLRPLMVVAGDHANNDMAGDDDDSWKSQFNASGYFDQVDCQIEGMGRIPEIEDIYISHASDAIGEKPAAWKAKDAGGTGTAAEGLEDGRYMLDVTLEGGSGKASVQSPAQVTVTDGKAEVIVVWSSDKYDYMIVDGQRYDNETVKGNSTFTIPVDGFNTPLSVVADTTAMSKPYEIEYTLTFALDDDGEE